MFYVKNKNIYTLDRKGVGSVLLAGVYMNLLLTFACLNSYIVFENDFFKIMALSNIRIIIVNLWPLNLSDGYYILSLLKKNPNMRMKMHCAIAEPKILFSLDSGERNYIIISVLVMVFMISIEFAGIISVLKVDKNYSNMVVLLFIASYMIFLHLLEKKSLYRIGKSN